MKTYQLIIAGIRKGEAWKKAGRWHWYIRGYGLEALPSGAKMSELRERIAYRCAVPQESIKLN